MRKKVTRYNKGYSISLAMAALLMMANAKTVAAAEEEIDTVDNDTELVEKSAETSETSKAEEVEPEEGEEKEEEKEEETAEEKEEEEKEEESPEAEEAATPEDVTLEKDTLLMTEKTKVTIEAAVGADAKVEDFNWTFNDKAIEDVKIWNKATGNFDDEENLITFTENPTIKDGVLHAELEFNYLFGTSDLERRQDKGGNLRRTFEKYIKDYALVITNTKNDQTISKTIHFFPYEHYLNYDMLQDKIDEIEEKGQAKEDRLVKVEKYGESEQGRPQRVGIVAKSQAAIDKYLNETHPKMLKSPDELIELIKAGKFTDPVAVMIHNTHADEKPGPEIVTGLFERFALDDVIEYESVDQEGKTFTVKYNVSDLLDRLILLFSFIENPDGHYETIREQVGTGMDLNRDHGYQVLQETKNTVALINKWDPVSFFDIHGFMKPMLIEPCTGPHDKNFEADLLYPILTDEAHAIGNAVTHNIGYEHMIPAEEWDSGWDDAFSGYTGVYALYQAIFGHTVEFPEMNDKSYFAGLAGITAGISHVYQTLDEHLLAKLGIFSRGIHKVEDPNVNEWLLDKDGNGARPENFFPDYYIIPLSKDQRNIAGAFEMIEYLRRNGIEVNELTEDAGGYKKGDLIVNMAQAKRGFANHVLSMGFDESVYEGMYAELVVNFPIMRGFDCYRILLGKDDKDIYKDLLGEVTHTSAPVHEAEAGADYYYIANNSKDAAQAVIEAISNGGKVYAGKDGFYFDHDTYQTMKNKYSLSAEAVKGIVKGEALQPVKIFAPESGENYARLIFPSEAENALKELGHHLVDNIEDADLVIMDSENFHEEYLGKKPTMILGGFANALLGKLIDGLEVGFTKFNHEGLLKAEVNKDNILSSGYEAEDYIYTNEGSWINKLPEGFTPLITVKDADDYFISGWWPGHEAARGKIMAAVGEYKGVPIFLYAGTPTTKKHAKAFYRWVNNGIYLNGVKEATVDVLPYYEQKLEELEGRVDQLEKENKELSDKVTALQKELAKVKAELAESQDTIKELQEKLEALECDLDEVEAEVEKEETDQLSEKEETDKVKKENLKVEKAEALPSAGEERGLAMVGAASLLGGLALVAAADDKKRKLNN